MVDSSRRVKDNDLFVADIEIAIFLKKNRFLVQYVLSS